MRFEDCLDAITALSGKQVDLEIWGDNDGAPVAFFSGELRPMPELGPIGSELLPPHAIAETAEIFLSARARSISGQAVSSPRNHCVKAVAGSKSGRRTPCFESARSAVPGSTSDAERSTQLRGQAKA
jgi:hypothetical protein